MKKLMAGFFIFFFVANSASAQIQTKTMIISGPADLIELQLKQVGSSVSNYTAMAAERRGNIQSLLAQLDRCGNCAERAEIESKIRYWRNLDTQLNNTITVILRGMGYPPSADIRNIVDPTYMMKQAALAERSRKLRDDVTFYCSNVLKKAGQDLISCQSDNNENFLYAMSKVASDLCGKYVTAVTGVQSPFPPPPLLTTREMMDKEAVRAWQIKMNAFRENDQKITACHQKYDQFVKIRFEVDTYKGKEQALFHWKNETRELRATWCAYKAHGLNKSTEEAAACMAQYPTDSVVADVARTYWSCQDKALHELGYSDANPAPSGTYIAGLNDKRTPCFKEADPRNSMRSEIQAMTKQFGLLKPGELSAYLSVTRPTSK